MRRFLVALTCAIAIWVTGCASAPGAITCTTGADCNARWSRAMQWLQQNSSWKVQTSTDTQLLTEGPLDARPAFEVTKVAQHDGTFQITMRAWCDPGKCDDLVAGLHSSFHEYVMGR